MTRQKTFLLFLMIACFWLLSGALLVAADALWSPRNENLFFNDHFLETDLAAPREYQAAGQSGKIQLWIAPESPRILSEYSNGSMFKGSFRYMDKTGTAWLLVESLDGLFASGWVREDELQVIYDDISFYEEHFSDLIPYEGQVNPDLLYDFVFWQYPGSERKNDVWLDPEFPLTHQDIAVPYAYIDADENRWAYYEVMGGKYAKGWVFYDDPYRTEPVTIDKSKPEPVEIPIFNNTQSQEIAGDPQSDSQKEALSAINIWNILETPLDPVNPAGQIMAQYSNLSCIEGTDQQIFCAPGTGLDFSALLDAREFAVFEVDGQTRQYAMASYNASYDSGEKASFDQGYQAAIKAYQQLPEFTETELDGIDAETAGAQYLTTFLKEDLICMLLGDEPADGKEGMINVICL